MAVVIVQTKSDILQLEIHKRYCKSINVIYMNSSAKLSMQVRRKNSLRKIPQLAGWQLMIVFFLFSACETKIAQERPKAKIANEFGDY